MRRAWPWVLVCLVLVFTAAVRWRLRDLPLERDEGEFAYSAQSMLRGVPPYRDAYSKKLPGVSAAYAVFLKVFGETPAGIHTGTLLVNAGAIVLVFLVGRRLWCARAGAFSAATYGLLSLDPGSFGLAGHATHFVVLAALAGLVALLAGLERDRLLPLLVSGVFLGLAVLMKQPGIVFLGFAGAWMLVHHARHGPIRWRRLAAQYAVVAGGAALPVALMALVLWRDGVLARAWLWSVVYAREYGYVGLRDAPSVLRENFGYVVQRSYPIWALAVPGAVATWWARRTRPQALFATLLLVFAFAGTSASFIYRGHYFILIMPAAAMLVGAGMVAMSGPGRVVAAVLFCVAAAWTIWLERDVFFFLTPEQVCRELYGANPFVESIEVGKYIAAHTDPDDRIAILGSEAQILFYARRPSATGYIYTYGLTQDQPHALEMQREMAAEIEAAKPRYVVVVHVPSSWLMTERSEPWIAEWLQGYARGLEPVGWVELWGDRSQSLWDDDARDHRPRSPFYLVVLKRKEEA
jgi:hypothetical protein